MPRRLKVAPRSASPPVVVESGKRGFVRRSKTPWIAPPPPRVGEEVRSFFRQVPDLFSKCLAVEREEYEEVIYRMDRPVTPGMVARAIVFRGAQVSRPPDHDLALLASAIQKARYPDPRPLLLASRCGLPLAAAVRALHFANPAFPLWDAQVARGLQSVAGREAPGFRAKFDRQGVEQYARFVRLIAKWREAISFHHVPEEPYFLARIIEGALTARAGAKALGKRR